MELEKINYEELYENAYNKDWKGWKDVKVVMEFIDTFSKSKKYPDSKAKHAFNFMNNYFVEKKILEIYPNLRFLGDDHEYLYKKLGCDIPDFISTKTKLTYELKTTYDIGFILSGKAKINWHKADRKLVYQTKDNTLYLLTDTNKVHKLCKLRAKFIDIKAYPYTDEDLGL